MLRHKLKLHPAGRGDFGHRTEPRNSVSRQAAGEAYPVYVGSTCDFRCTPLRCRHVTKSFHQQSGVAIVLLDRGVQVCGNVFRCFEVIASSMFFHGYLASPFYMPPNRPGSF